MEIQQLRHLQAAANSQSYAQAAKKCFTSRQNIAHSVKALEGEVGTPLFERKGNRMVLTEEGRQVAYVVDEVLERVDRLGSMFQDGLAARSMLNLAVSTNFFAGMPLAVDELLLERSSSFRFFERDCGECYRLVCSNEVDAAIIIAWKENSLIAALSKSEGRNRTSSRTRGLTSRKRKAFRSTSFETRNCF